MNEVSAESQDNHDTVDTVGSCANFDGSVDGNEANDISSQDDMAQNIVTKIPSIARIQHDLELWCRAKDYDQRAMKIPFVPVLTRKQKQHIAKTTTSKPYKTRPKGDQNTSN